MGGLRSESHLTASRFCELAPLLSCASLLTGIGKRSAVLVRDCGAVLARSASSIGSARRLWLLPAERRLRLLSLGCSASVGIHMTGVETG